MTDQTFNKPDDEVPPNVAGAITAFRDTGYTPFTALADICDNSITAEATRIDVEILLDPLLNATVAIVDNGHGMTPEELTHGMQFAGQHERQPGDLGKFGLGLKTASLSVCKTLTVITKSQTDDTPHAAQWDLEHVIAENRWMLRYPVVRPEWAKKLKEITKDGPGTLVLWESIDRMLPREYQRSRDAQRAVTKISADLQKHLALTYFKFLQPEDGSPPLRITFNGDEVECFNPFQPKLGTDKVAEVHVPVTVDGEESGFTITAWVLPPRSDLSAEQIQEADIGTHLQGIYVFRENRLISHGDWLGNQRIEPHLNLCRVDFSFDSSLDRAMKVDFKKSQITLVDDLKKKIIEIIGPARREANTRYRDNEKTTAVRDGTGLHRTSNKTIRKKEDAFSRANVTPMGNGKAEVRNTRGVVQIELPIHQGDQPHVHVVESIDDGYLWEPGLVKNDDGAFSKAVRLNVSHPFYPRVYQANKANGVAVQGIDYLLWALAEAEQVYLTESDKQYMDGIRREVSTILRQLVNDLPDPPDTESDT